MQKISFKALRAEKKYNQEDVAKYLGISTEAYKRKENGLTEFKFNELIKMSELFDVQIDLFRHP